MWDKEHYELRNSTGIMSCGMLRTVRRTRTKPTFYPRYSTLKFPEQHTVAKQINLMGSIHRIARAINREDQLIRLEAIVNKFIQGNCQFLFRMGKSSWEPPKPSISARLGVRSPEGQTVPSHCVQRCYG